MDPTELAKLRELHSQLGSTKKVSADQLQQHIGPSGGKGLTQQHRPLEHNISETDMSRIAELFSQLKTADQAIWPKVEQELLKYGDDAVVMALGFASRTHNLDIEDQAIRLIKLCTQVASKSAKARTILLGSLEADPVSRRRLAARVLGELRETEAIESLRRLLQQPECWFDAAMALLDLRDEESAALLVKTIAQINPNNRADVERNGRGWRIAQRMKDLGAVAAGPLVQEYLACDKYPVRNLLGRAILGLQDYAVDALANILVDEDEELAKDAAWALGSIGTAKTTDHLLKALEAGKGSIRTIVEVLGRVRKEYPASTKKAGRALVEFVKSSPATALRGSAVISAANLLGSGALDFINEAERMGWIAGPEAAMARARAGSLEGIKQLWDLAMATNGHGSDQAIRYLAGMGDAILPAAEKEIGGRDDTRALVAAHVVVRLRYYTPELKQAIVARLKTAGDALRKQLYKVIFTQEDLRLQLYMFRDQEKNPLLRQELQLLIDMIPKDAGRPKVGRG